MIRASRWKRCHLCFGRLRPGTTRLFEPWGRRYVILEDVPARVCVRCHMKYFDAVVVKNVTRILQRRKLPSRRVLQVPVADFSKQA